MSHSPQSPQATDQERYQQAWMQLGEQILRGRSFSGRERHHAFINVGHGQFAEASAAVGFDYPEDGRALALGDLDDDGDTDVVISHRSAPRLRILRNDAPRGHVLGLRLLGPPGNRDGVGAQVRVTGMTAAGEKRGPFVGEVVAGDGFLAQSSANLRVGIGDVVTVAELDVLWPGGARTSYKELQTDAAYTLTHGSPVAVLRKRFATDGQAAPLPALQLPKPGTARVFFAASVPLPPLPYLSSGGPQQLTAQPGRALLVVLWASWCKPCAVELADLTTHVAELTAAGVDVLALSVDAVAANAPPDAAQADIWARDLGFRGPVGAATAPLIAAIEALHAFLTMTRQPLPLPSSLLVDRRGELAAVYKGAVSVQRVVADANVDGNLTARSKAEVVSPDGVRLAQGQWLHPQRAIHYSELTDALAHGGLRNLAAAILALRLHTLPETAVALNDLGVALAKIGEVGKAEPLFARAVQLAPDDPEARDNLARARRELGAKK